MNGHGRLKIWSITRNVRGYRREIDDMNNVCAARFLEWQDEFKGMNEFNRPIYIAKRPPHEPTMYDTEHYLMPIDPHIRTTVLIKVCRHCGC